MGFSVTATQLIFLVTALAAGGAFVGAVFTAAGDVGDGYREAWRTRDASLNEAIEIADGDNAPAYSSGQQRFTVWITNTGPTVVEIDGLSHFIDGVYANDLVVLTRVENTVGGDTTNLVLPGETLQVRFEPVTQAPTRYKVVTTAGTESIWTV